jgi:uncharacterized membrane protein YfcA
MTVTFVLIGLAAGVFAGLFGVGGGILIVPALMHFAQFSIKQATGSSLGALLLPVGILGAMTYYRAGHLNVQASLLVAVGLLFGAWGGAKLAMLASPVVVQRMFAAFLVVVAVRMWLKA